MSDKKNLIQYGMFENIDLTNGFKLYRVPPSQVSPIVDPWYYTFVNKNGDPNKNYDTNINTICVFQGGQANKDQYYGKYNTQTGTPENKMIAISSQAKLYYQYVQIYNNCNYKLKFRACGREAFKEGRSFGNTKYVSRYERANQIKIYLKNKNNTTTKDIVTLQNLKQEFKDYSFEFKIDNIYLEGSNILVFDGIEDRGKIDRSGDRASTMYGSAITAIELYPYLDNVISNGKFLDTSKSVNKNELTKFEGNDMIYYWEYSPSIFIYNETTSSQVKNFVLIQSNSSNPDYTNYFQTNFTAPAPGNYNLKFKIQPIDVYNIVFLDIEIKYRYSEKKVYTYKADTTFLNSLNDFSQIIPLTNEEYTLIFRGTPEINYDNYYLTDVILSLNLD